MREINASLVKKTVEELSISANIALRKDIETALKRAALNEKKKSAKGLLMILLENARIAKKDNLAICQDTGLVICDIEIGQDVRIVGGDLKKAVNSGVESGYKKGYFRRSCVHDPILRNRKPQAGPAIIYIDIVKGSRVRITVSPKGFGSENKTRIRMFDPTADRSEIIQFILDTVKEAGPDACPPFILGIGIGGTSDKAALLAKKALYRAIDRRNPKRHLARLETEIFKKANKLNIGPAGLGGMTTCLGVNILDAPTHIAGLPVAVNVGCHVTRSKTKIL